MINGHLAWTAQNASGNRGDDFRALKLAELQPHTMLHPNKETAMYSVLGLQGEEKAGRRGMRTVGFASFNENKHAKSYAGGEPCIHCFHCTSTAGNVPTRRIRILPSLSP